MCSGCATRLVQGVFAAALLIGVHDVVDHDPLGVDGWIPVATLVVVGAMVHRLTSELRRADGERLRIEHERAEVESGRAASEAERARREAAMGRLGGMALARPIARRCSTRPSRSSPRRSASPTARSSSSSRAATACGRRGDRRRDRPRPDPGRRGSPLTGWVLAGEEPVTVWEWASERRFDAPGLRDRGIRSTAAAAIRGRTGAFGIIGVHAADLGVFSADDAQWLQSMADLLASALDRDESEARMRHQSLHDALTGLPNRTLFFDRIEHAFARAERAGFVVAVLLLDVDHFKTVNDSLGHERRRRPPGRGRLAPERRSLRSSDTVARLGGDEFVVLCEVESDEDGLRDRRAHRRGLGAAVPVAGGEVFARRRSASRCARRPRTPATMLREADAAMYRAKERGRGGSSCSTRACAATRSAPAHRVRPAPRARARRVPRPSTSRSSTPSTAASIARRGARALAAPDRGLVAPGRVHPVAEETGLIAPLGRGVLEARRRRRSRLAPSASPTPLGSRSTSRPAARAARVPAEVRAALEASGLPPERLGLEITEIVLIKDDRLAALAPSRPLRGSGCRSLSTTSAPATRRWRA